MNITKIIWRNKKALDYAPEWAFCVLLSKHEPAWTCMCSSSVVKKKKTALCFLSQAVLLRRCSIAANNMFLYLVRVTSLKLGRTCLRISKTRCGPHIKHLDHVHRSCSRVSERVCKWLHLVTISDLIGSLLTQYKGQSWYRHCSRAVFSSFLLSISQLQEAFKLPHTTFNWCGLSRDRMKMRWHEHVHYLIMSSVLCCIPPKPLLYFNTSEIATVYQTSTQPFTLIKNLIFWQWRSQRWPVNRCRHFSERHK